MRVTYKAAKRDIRKDFFLFLFGFAEKNMPASAVAGLLWLIVFVYNVLWHNLCLVLLA